MPTSLYMTARAWLALCLAVALAVAPVKALAGSMLLLGAGNNPVAGGGTITFGQDATNYAGYYSAATAANAFPLVCPSAQCLVSGSSSTQFGIGAASSNRVAVVSFDYTGAGAGANAVITGVMFNGTVSGASCIGGTAATQIGDTGFVSINAFQGQWYAALPTGTTTTVCFTSVGGNGWSADGSITVSYLNDSLGAAHMTVSSSNYTVPPGIQAGNCAGNLCTASWTGTTVPAGGIGLATSFVDGDATTPVTTWSGAASPTKQSEAHETGGTSATQSIATWTTSGTVSISQSTNGLGGFVGAIFAP